MHGAVLLAAVVGSVDGSMTWPGLALAITCAVGAWLAWWYWVPMQQAISRMFGFYDEHVADNLNKRRFLRLGRGIALVMACLLTLTVFVGLLDLLARQR